MLTCSERPEWVPVGSESMSIHKSLVLRGKLKRHRNVLTRTERLSLLVKDGKWKEGDSFFGLPKVRHIMYKVKGKPKKEAAAARVETAAATADALTPAAAPAAPITPKPTAEKTVRKEKPATKK